MYNNSAVLAICGPGLCGKDEIAKWLSLHTSLPYTHSTSYAAAIVMFKEIKDGKWDKDYQAYKENYYAKQYPVMREFHIPVNKYHNIEQFYSERRYNRDFWSKWIDCFNLEDDSLTRLYQLACLQGNRILTGIRKRRELVGCINTGLVDLTIWIEKPFITEPDLTQEYGPEMCDVIINNDGTLPQLHEKLARIVRGFQLVFDI